MRTLKGSVGLVVLAFACAGSACGSGDADEPVAERPVATEAPVSAPEGSADGGLRLELHAHLTRGQRSRGAQPIDRAMAVLRDRAARMRIAGATFERSGATGIVATLPGVRDRERAARQLGSTGRLSFLDWEPNVLDKRCRAHPGRVDGGQRPVTGLYQAVERASACPPGNRTTAELRFYGFERRSHRPVHGGVPFATAAAARRAGGGGAETLVLAVPRGIAVLRSEDLRPPGQQPGEYDVWWVVRDATALPGRDIRDPEQNFDSGAGGQPIVTMEFSAGGRAAFSRLTRAVARRGARHAVPGGDPVGASHHFAIRLDDEVLSKPYIDFRENPDGIDGSTGAQIAGGFTVQDARDLATLLALPPLPVRIHVAASKPIG